MWDFIASLFSPVSNFLSGLFTNKTNKQNVADTNAANMAMNSQNIQFQKEENEIARQREDNAVQRRASDLTAAGLSKTLAAGSPASANAMNAPNNTFEQKAFQADSPRFDFDYGALKQNLANADAVKQNADTASRQADLEEKRLMFEIQKWNEEHGFEVKKWSDEFEFKKKVHYDEYSLEQKKFGLSVRQLQLSAVDLNDKLQNSMSERQYKKYQMGYTAALTIAAQNEDARKQAMLKYDMAESMARIKNYVSNFRFNNMQILLVKEQLPKVIAETSKLLSEKLEIDARTAQAVAETVETEYNIAIAEAEGTTTHGAVVGESAAAQNKATRHTELAGKAIQGVSTFFSVGLGAFLGGVSGRFVNKMLSMEERHNLYKDR